MALARDLDLGTSGGADVTEIEADLVGIGMEWRHYPGGAPRGFHTVAGLTLFGGDGRGADDAGRRRDYRLAGWVASPLGLGYQHLLFDRISIEAAASLQTSLGWLWERGGGDHGTVGGYGVGARGVVGLAF